MVGIASMKFPTIFRGKFVLKVSDSRLCYVSQLVDVLIDWIEEPSQEQLSFVKGNHFWMKSNISHLEMISYSREENVQ